jgi:hypothetical protein
VTLRDIIRLERRPMNAIIGMAELLLRENLPSELFKIEAGRL